MFCDSKNVHNFLEYMEMFDGQPSNMRKICAAHPNCVAIP